MASSSIRMQPVVTELADREYVHWGAVWGGVFIFAAIWTVFESLALAIFGHAAFGTGMAIWTVILTIVAMYVAGMETARLAGIANKHDGITHGLMMFGLSLTGMIALCAMVLNALNASPQMKDLWSAGLTPGIAWTSFLSLFLGWLAAMIGASALNTQRTERKEVKVTESNTLRPAA